MASRNVLLRMFVVFFGLIRIVVTIRMARDGAKCHPCAIELAYSRQSRERKAKYKLFIRKPFFYLSLNFVVHVFLTKNELS